MFHGPFDDVIFHAPANVTTRIKLVWCYGEKLVIWVSIGYTHFNLFIYFYLCIFACVSRPTSFGRMVRQSIARVLFIYL